MRAKILRLFCAVTLTLCTACGAKTADYTETGKPMHTEVVTETEVQQETTNSTAEVDTETKVTTETEATTEIESVTETTPVAETVVDTSISTVNNASIVIENKTKWAKAYAKQLYDMLSAYDLSKGVEYEFAKDTVRSDEMADVYVYDSETPIYIVHKPDAVSWVYNTYLVFCDIDSDGTPEMGVSRVVVDDLYAGPVLDFYNIAGTKIGTCLPFTYLTVIDNAVYGVMYEGNASNITKLTANFPSVVVMYDYTQADRVTERVYITDETGKQTDYIFSDPDWKTVKAQVSTCLKTEAGIDDIIIYGDACNYVVESLLLDEPANYTESDIENAIAEMLNNYIKNF